jgi:hypothetical protein
MSIPRKKSSFQGTIGVWMSQGPQTVAKTHSSHIVIYLNHLVFIKHGESI